MDTAQKIAALQRCDILAAADEKTLQWLAEAATVEDFGPHESVFEAGEDSTHVYVVVEGSLEVRLSPTSRLVSFFEPGALFGEYAMFANGTRTAEVVTATPTKLLLIKEGHFRALLLESPAVAVLILEKVVRRLQRAERHQVVDEAGE